LLSAGILIIELDRRSWSLESTVRFDIRIAHITEDKLERADIVEIRIVGSQEDGVEVIKSGASMLDISVVWE